MDKVATAINILAAASGMVFRQIGRKSMTSTDIRPPSRAIGWITVATGIASIAVLLNHPAEHATDFNSLLKEEAANQMINAIVHGGFMIVLAIQIVCYAVFTGRRMGWAKSLAVAGFTFFAVGAAFQMASLLVDGLMIPAIAQRYLLAPPDRLPFARSLFALCGTAVQFLMPIGIGFQAAGAASWGTAILRSGAGIAGLVLGLATMAAIVAATLTGAQHLLLIAIALLALWAIVAGIALLQRPK